MGRWGSNSGRLDPQRNTMVPGGIVVVFLMSKYRPLSPNRLLRRRYRRSSSSAATGPGESLRIRESQTRILHCIAVKERYSRSLYQTRHYVNNHTQCDANLNQTAPRPQQLT